MQKDCRKFVNNINTNIFGVTYRYVLGSLPKARSLKIETDFLFYLQLKTHPEFNSSKIYLGRGYLKKISYLLDISETTASTRMNSLLKSSFVTKVSNKYENTEYYNLCTWSDCYSNIFGYSNSYQMTNTVKLKEKYIQKRDKLKRYLDMIEITRNIQKHNNREVSNTQRIKTNSSEEIYIGGEITDEQRQRVLKLSVEERENLNKQKITNTKGLRTWGVTKHDLKGTKLLPNKEVTMLHFSQGDSFSSSIKEYKTTLYVNTRKLGLEELSKRMKVSISYVSGLIAEMTRLGVLNKQSTSVPYCPGSLREGFELRMGLDSSKYFSKKRQDYFHQWYNLYSFRFSPVFSKHRRLCLNMFKTAKTLLLNWFDTWENSENLLLRTPFVTQTKELSLT